MLLTIITRTYAGREGMLAKAAESILAQTYRPIEWLIIEDGPARSEMILRDIRFPEGITPKVATNRKEGRSAAANLGLSLASGELLCFFDDDDELFPNHAARLVGLLHGYPEAAGAYAAAYQTPISFDGPLFEDETIFFTPTVSSCALIWQNLFPIQAVVFRRSIVRWNRFDTNLDALEDWLFWLCVFLERKLVWTPEPTSRFFVPSGEDAKTRLLSHYDASRYLDLQKGALLRERGIGDTNRLKAWHDGKILDLYASIYNREVKDTDRISAPAESSSDRVSALNAGLISRRDRKSRAVGAKNVVFTSITLGYLPKALVLARSIKKFHPDWEFHILLNDQVPQGLLERLEDVDVIVNAASLGIERFHSWCFSMSLVELCCATKPTYFSQLLNAGYENVFFIDPDIKLFNDLGYLLDRLKLYDVLITPHCDKPAIRDSEIFFTERSVLAHGLYNLGFLAARASQNAKDVIEFWRTRLARYCHDDHRNGLFNDQKWFNLVPVYFKNIDVIEHEGCNVASWNISHRPISLQGGQLFSGKDPLLFFHFSGYDAKVPRTMFEIFGQYNDALAHILTRYDGEVAENKAKYGESEFEWAFKQFDNAVEISEALRRFYRSSLDTRVMFPEPYFAGKMDSFFDYAKSVGFSEIEERFKPQPFG